MIDIVGYIGMGFVLVSFLFKDIRWVRIVNMIGAVLSLVYGILSKTLPTALLNGSLFVINSIYLTVSFTREHKAKKKAALKAEQQKADENQQAEE